MALSLLLLISVVFLLIKNFFFRVGPKLPPGPNALHLLTYLPSLVYNPHIALQNLSKIYGPLLSLKLGGQIMVVASSPDAAKELYKTHGRAFAGRHLPALYHYLPGTMHSSIVLSPECNKSWKHLRSICQNCLFSSKAMESNASVVEAKVAEMVRFFRCKQGEVVNVEHIIFATLANIISTVLTSRNLFDIEAQGSDDYEGMMGLVNEVVEKTTTLGLVDYLPILKGVDFWSKVKAMNLHRKIKLTWGGIIQARIRSTTHCSNQDFLATVLADQAFSEDEIANALMEILIGATDTTTITAVWVVVELMKNEEMLRKVREEIGQAVEGEHMSYSVLSECKLFEACIKETLRLHVPAPLIVPHRATERCNLNEYVIDKGSMVVVNAWGIARDPKYWDHPTTFKPERFLHSDIGFRGTNFEYLPFGTGLRMCPGSTVALNNILMMVASLLHYFHWTLPNHQHPTSIDTNHKYATTLKKENPLLLIPIPT